MPVTFCGKSWYAIVHNKYMCFNDKCISNKFVFERGEAHHLLYRKEAKFKYKYKYKYKNKCNYAQQI